MITYLSTDSVETEPVTEQMLAELERSAGRTSGLVPFSDMTEAPEDAEWNRVDDPAVAAIVPGAKVYDLTWRQEGTSSAAVMFRRWRVFVGVRTNLPKRVEWYVKSEPQAEYTFETFAIVVYPSESEIQTVIRNTFGSAASRLREPEYIGTPGLR